MFRIGMDLGGTKIEGMALDANGVCGTFFMQLFFRT
jgi:hypothetical protein